MDSEMVGQVPERVAAAEQRARFQDLLDSSSLGDPEVKAGVERTRQEMAALPDRWMRLADLPGLLGLYRDRRETWAERHATAVAYVLAEVDYEPSQDDLQEVSDV